MNLSELESQRTALTILRLFIGWLIVTTLGCLIIPHL